MNDEERKRKIEEMRKRLADIPYEQQLANLWWHQTHCFQCEAEVTWDAEVCEKCGCELMEYGKH